jgi:hypothetical protein
MENVARSRRSQAALDLALFGLSLAASGFAVWLLGRLRGWWR